MTESTDPAKGSAETAPVKVVIVVRPGPSPAKPTESTESTAEPAQQAAPAPRRKRGCLFRLAVLLLLLALLPLLLRLLLPWIIPYVLSEVGRELGVQVRYESLDVSVFDGSYRARGVVISPLEGGEPLITVDSVEAELDLGVLFDEGRSSYRTFLVEGLEGVVETLPDGRLAWEDRIERHLYPNGKPADHEDSDDFLFYELFSATRSRIRWLDRSVEPPVDAWLDIDLLAHDWNSIRDPYWPDRLELTLGTEARPGAAKITSRFDGVDTRIDLRVHRLHAESAAPYFHDAGIRTEAAEVDFDLGWKTRAPQPGEPRRLELRDGRVAVDGREVLVLKRALLDPLYREKDANLGELQLGGLELELIHRADGGWVVAGFRSFDRSEEAGSRIYDLKGLLIQASRLSVHDRTVSPPVHMAFGIRELRTGAFGESSSEAPVEFEAEVFAPHLAGGIAAVGTFAPTTERSEWAARVEMRQVTGRALEPYLKTMGLRPVLDDASIRFDIESSTAPVGSEAYASRTVVRGLEIEERGTHLLRFDELGVRGRKLDTTREEYAFDGVVLRGVEAKARFRMDGGSELGGFEIIDPPEALPGERASRWEIDELALQLRRVEWRNEALIGTPPLVLRDVRATTQRPLVIEGLHRESSPPIELELTGEIAPVASHCSVSVQLRPYAAEPSHAFNARITGLRGNGLLAMRPWMREHWAEGNLTDGVLRATGRVVARPVAPGRAEGGFEVDLEEVSLEATPAGPTLVKIDQGRLFVERFDPASGDLEASRLELARPYLLVRRTEKGLLMLGLRRLPPVVEPAEDVFGPAPPPTGGGAFGPEQRINEVILSGGEVLYRDERAKPWAEVPVRELDLRVHGFSSRALFQARPVVFRGTATAGMVDLPWRRALKGVKRSKVLSFLTFGKIVRPVEERADLDRRVAFGSLEVEGRLTLAPELRGTADLKLKGFELPIFRGLAEQNDLTITHGRLGLNSRAEFRGQDPIRIDSTFEFYKLRLSDEGGFGRKLGLPGPTDVAVAALEDSDSKIKIPVTVEVDAEKGLGSRQTKDLIASGIGSAVTRALRKSPLTLGSAIKGLGEKAIYLLPKSVRERIEGKKLPPLGPVTMTFAPGDAYLAPAEAARLESLMAHVREGVTLELTLQHEMGAGDVELAERRANPGEDALHGILRGLRSRQGEILERRQALHVRAQAALQAGDAKAFAEVSSRLRVLDEAYGRLERSRDGVFELLSERSGWDVRRRCREGALSVGRHRLEAVKQTLLGFGQANVAGRIEVRPPVFKANGAQQGSVTVIPKALERD